MGEENQEHSRSDRAAALPAPRPEAPGVNEGSEGFDLLSAVADAEPQALAELYARYSDVVYRMAYWMTESAADAADVTQDVFIGLPEALPALRSTTWQGFESWLKTIAVRAALQTIRKRKRLGEVPFNTVFFGGKSARMDNAVDRIAIDRALRQLTANQRAVFTLKEVEGFSHKEISKILGITLGASEALMHRARRRLFGLLGGGR